MEKVCAQDGKNETGNMALLMKTNGKNRTLARAEIVSVFLVAIPTVRKMPERASSKNAEVSSNNSIPGAPDEKLTPIAIATPIVMADWATATVMSVNSLPYKIAGLLTCVSSIFERNPELRSFAIETPPCGAVIIPLNRTIPGTRYARYPPEVAGRKSLNFVKSCEKRTRKRTGSIRLVPSSVGFLTNFFRNLSRSDCVSKRTVIPAHITKGSVSFLESSSDLIRRPVSRRNTSSKVGVETLRKDGLMPFRSRVVTSSAMI